MKDLRVHGDATNEIAPVSFRLLDTRTGLVRRVLGTSPATNAPHLTVVWVQREGEQGAQAWSADQLMSAWHDLVAIDEEGRRQAPEPVARELDIWLSEGVVLVDPMPEGDRMIFQRWVADGAELRNSRTGVLHVVSQSYVTTWKYIPREVEANQVWRSKETGALVLIVETRGEGVQLRGLKKNDTPFWLSHAQVVEFFVWTSELPL